MIAHGRLRGEDHENFQRDTHDLFSLTARAALTKPSSQS